MRKSRIGLVLALALAAGAITITALPAGAADAPSAPFTAITEHLVSPFATNNINAVVTPADATFTDESTPTTVKFNAVRGGKTSVANLSPPTDGALAVGTYQVKASAAAGFAGFGLTTDGNTCALAGTGQVTIAELTRDPITQKLASFAASYEVSCGLSVNAAGELRWNSATGYVGRTVDKNSFAFGAIGYGYPTPPQTVTITSAGSEPLQVGSPTVSGTNASYFAVTGGTCAGATLAFGQTCTVTVVATPAVFGDFNATLTIPDNTLVGRHTVRMTVAGRDPVGAAVTPFSFNFTAPEGTPLPPQNGTIASIGQATLQLGQARIEGTHAQFFALTNDTCSEASLAPGQSCTFTITTSATARGFYQAYLVVPDNTSSGSRTLSLRSYVLSAANATVSSTDLQFGTVPAGQSSPPQAITFTSTGTAPLEVTLGNLGGAHPAAFKIVADTCTGQPVAPGATCAISVVAQPPGGASYSGILYVFDNTDVSTRIVSMFASGLIGATGTYYPLPPARIMDTREGLGASMAPIGPNSTIKLQVAGRGGVPATGVGAVVLNVTVTQPSAGSYLSVYPTGVTRPNSSSLNFPKGWTGANSVTVKVGGGGRVDVYNAVGTAHVIVDVVGFYAAAADAPSGFGFGGQFQPLLPERLLDTREFGQQLGPGEAAYVGLDFGPDNTKIRAYAVNITAVKPTGSGYLAAWNGIGAVPTTSTLNYTIGRVVPNFAIVPTAPCDLEPSCAGIPMIGVYAGGRASVDVLVDVVGFYDDSTLDGGLRFKPITPTRIADTRTLFGGHAFLGAKVTSMFIAPDTVADANTHALAMNVTAAKPTTNTFVTVWPAQTPMPGVSNLNPAKGQTIPNAAVTLVDNFNQFNVYNAAGQVDVIIDVVGVFQPGAAAFFPSATAAPSLRYSPPLDQPRTAKPATPIIVQAVG